MPVKAIATHALSSLFCVVLCAGIALHLGQDTNYDQLNYHYYIADALLTGRFDRDVAPAQLLHSFFNPILYLPFYELVRHQPPYRVGIVLGGLHGLNLWLVGLIAWHAARELQSWVRIGSVAAAVAISAASPEAISEIGTSMSDVLISIPVLAGLAIFLPTGQDRSRWLRLGFGGALIGAATGLKLTAAAFAIGIGASAFIGWGRWRERWAPVFTVGAGGLAGFALTGGVWCWMLWRRFGNPVFPYFNAFFHSPDYQSSKSAFDDRYIAHGALAALSYPFRWAKVQHLTSELDFRDPRFALLIVLGLLAAALAAARPATGRPDPVGRRLIIFFMVAFVVWLREWSIQRYLVPLELLTGPAMLVLLLRLDQTKLIWPLPVAGAVLAILSLTAVRHSSWGRLPWGPHWYVVERPPPDAARPVYFLDTENPLSYIVPELEPGAIAIGLVAWEDLTAQPNSVFMRRIALALDPTHHDLWRAVSVGSPSNGFKYALERLGLKLKDDCVTTPGRPRPLTWCGLEIVDRKN